MNNNNSCIERARPADDEPAAPDSLNGGSDSELSKTLVSVRRRNPGAKTAQRHKRYLWEDVFRYTLKIASVTEAARTADLAIAEWEKRWEPNPTAEGEKQP